MRASLLTSINQQKYNNNYILLMIEYTSIGVNLRLKQTLNSTGRGNIVDIVTLINRIIKLRALSFVNRTLRSRSKWVGKRKLLEESTMSSGRGFVLTHRNYMMTRRQIVVTASLMTN